MPRKESYTLVHRQIDNLAELVRGCKAREMLYLITEGKKKTSLQVWIRTKEFSEDSVYTKVMMLLIEALDAGWVTHCLPDTRIINDVGETKNIRKLHDYDGYFKWNDISRYLKAD